MDGPDVDSPPPVTVASALDDYLERLTRALADRYTIVREIGSGGMARVFLAKDLKHNRDVALKVLRPEFSAGMGVQRFLREVEIAARLSHPHIVPLLDSGSADGFVYYAMPYVKGESLRERLARGAELQLPEALRVMRDVADALEHAHGHGVIHRDIKPGNVMISGRHALVMDFGIAKALRRAAGEEGLTSGVLVGTPAYMAPEQATGDEEVDHRADIYAFGVLAYELLAGRPPFAGRTVQETMMAHIAQPAPNVSERRAGIPPELGDLVMRCLEKTPVTRWQSTPELLSRIDALLAPVAATTDSGPEAASRARRLAGVVLVVLAAAGAATWMLRPDAEARTLDPDRIVVLPFRNQTGDGAMNEVGQMASEWITRGLHLEGIGEAVPAATVSQLLASSADAPNPAGLLAEFANAGVSVSGSLFIERDTVVFNSEVIDTNNGRLIGAIDPVRAPNVLEGVSAVRDRVLGLLAAHHGFGAPAVQQTPPPSVEIFRAWFAGREAFSRGAIDEAAEQFRLVSELDPTFVSHLPLAAWAEITAGRYDRADSLIAVALRSTARMTSVERTSAEYTLAWTSGDLDAELRYATIQGDLDPTLVYNQALAALRNNRPGDALNALASVDLDSPFSSQWIGAWYLGAAARHALGDHEAELDVAREGTGRHPQSLEMAAHLMRALAALGMVDELEQLGGSLPSEANFSWPPFDTRGWAMTLAALELEAHGSAASADTVMARAIAWYRDAVDRRPNDENLRYGLAQTYYFADRWEDAEPIFVALSRENPSAVDYVGFLGVIAARAGDRAHASTLDDRLAAWEGRYLFGRQTRWRARIASLLGDQGRALELLRSAFEDGISLYPTQGWDWLHLDPDLEGLRTVEAYREWSAPRG